MNQTKPSQTAAQILEEILECLSIDCQDFPKEIQLKINKKGHLVVKETFFGSRKEYIYDKNGRLLLEAYEDLKEPKIENKNKNEIINQKIEDFFRKWIEKDGSEEDTHRVSIYLLCIENIMEMDPSKKLKIQKTIHRNVDLLVKEMNLWKPNDSRRNSITSKYNELIAKNSVHAPKAGFFLNCLKKLFLAANDTRTPAERKKSNNIQFCQNKKNLFFITAAASSFVFLGSIFSNQSLRFTENFLKNYFPQHTPSLTKNLQATQKPLQIVSAGLAVISLVAGVGANEIVKRFSDQTR